MQFPNRGPLSKARFQLMFSYLRANTQESSKLLKRAQVVASPAGSGAVEVRGEWGVETSLSSASPPASTHTPPRIYTQTSTRSILGVEDNFIIELCSRAFSIPGLRRDANCG